MARKSDWTPPPESSRSAAILPGVPLPDWALSDEPFVPDLDFPDVHLAAVSNQTEPAAYDLAELNLEDLTIADMEAALRDFSAQISAAPVEVAVPEDDHEQAPPIEFAVPGYPATPAAPQVQMPPERPGYPDVANSGPIVVTPSAGPALVIPPPPPPPIAAFDAPASQATGSTQQAEPIRLDLPMSAVLAREFTRTTPWQSGHAAVSAPGAAPVVAPAPAHVVALAPAHVAAPAPVVDATPAPVVVAPLVAAVAIPLPVESFTDHPTIIPETVEPTQERVPAKQGIFNRRLLTLIGLGAALALLAAAAAFFLPGILNPTAAPEASPSATAVNTPTPSAATPTAIVPANFVLQTPDTIGDLTKMSGPIDLSLRAATTASAIPGLTDAVSAVYGTGKVPGATVIAWHASTAPAATSVSQAFAGFQSSAKTTVTNVSGVSSTGLPGQMSCGETTINATPTTLCFWADPATFGSITVVAPATPAEGALTAAQIRSSVEYQK